MNKINCDVTIVGGGLAGICAGIAAARNGNSVSLIHNRPVLGGNSSSEIRVWTRGSTGGGNIFSEEMGILGELKLANQYRNREGNPVVWDDILLDAVLAEKNISLYLNTLVTTVAANNGHINHIVADSINDENHYSFCSPYYIDASGEGILAVAAGMDFIIGKESKYTYQEAYGEEKQNPTTLGCTLLFFTIKKDHKVVYKAPSYAYSLEKIEEILGNGGRVVNKHTDGSDLWWIEFGGEIDTLHNMSFITLELKKLTLGIFNYIKNSGKFESDNLDLLWVGNLPGKRESRRFITDHILTSTEIITQTKFDDVAFYGGWYLDFHPSKGIYSTDNNCQQIKVNTYGIPLSCLYNSTCDNVLLAGRIIGTTHGSFASTRIMNTCGLSGEAAGTAIAVLIKNHQRTRYLKDHYSEVQKLLIDMLLIGKEPHEKGLAYSVQAKSIDSFKSKESGNLLLSSDIYLTTPSDVLKKTSIAIDNLKNKEITLSFKATSSPLPSTCSSHFEQWGSIVLKEGRNIIDLSMITLNSGYITIVFEKKDGISFPRQKDNLFGFLLGYYNQNGNYNPLIKMKDYDSYNQNNLHDGFTRPYNRANIYLTNPSEEPQIIITMKDSALCDDFENLNMEFFFDPGLDVEMVSSHSTYISKSHNISFRQGVAPTLVKNFEVIVINGANQTKYQVKDNYQRHTTVTIKANKNSIMFVHLQETYGSKLIGLFEIKLSKKEI